MFFKTSIIHPFLFAVFPIIHLYSINFFEVSIDEIILPILVSVLVTCVFLILSKLILKDWVKSGLIVSLLIILVFFYGHIYNLLNTGILADAEIGRHRYLMIMSLVVFIIGTVLIIKTQIKLDNLNIIINVIAITLIIITIPNFTYGSISTLEANEEMQLERHEKIYELKNTDILNSTEKPDVYYIILDGYGGTKRMKQDFGFDNYGFLSELTNRGFFASDSSSSNYPSTQWSVPSIFSMNYLPTKEKEQSDIKYAFLIRELQWKNEVMRNFHDLDYEIITYQPSGYNDRHFGFVDQFFCQEENSKNSKFNEALLRISILNYFINLMELENKRQNILCGFSEIVNLKENENKPIFAFMHLMIPHPPYAFDSNGGLVIGGRVHTEEGSFVDEEKYVNTIKFANKKILEVVENILENNEKAIIIIQSDHGYDFEINHKNPSKTSLKQRFSNINAIYVPDKDVFYEGVTPVNTFRIIFNECFGASYEILEDRMYYHPYAANIIHKDIKFQDITKIIVN